MNGKTIFFLFIRLGANNHLDKDIDDLEEFIEEHRKGVSMVRKRLEITILEKEDFIKYLQNKLKAKEDSNSGNRATLESEVHDVDERHEEKEDEVETIETNTWQVRQGTTFKCPICNYTRKTESQISKHMQVHDDKVKTTSPQKCSTKSSLSKCPICGYTSNTIKDIERHMKCHDEKEEDSMFNCAECHFQSMNRDQLIKHLT